MEIRLATIEGLKINVSESDKAAAEANAKANEIKMQLETAKATIDSLVAEGIRMQECLKSKDMELNESKARIASLEGDLKTAQCMDNTAVSFDNPEPAALKKVLVTSSNADANGGCGSTDPEIEQLRTALEVSEIRYQEEQTRMIIETKSAYEMLETVKAECARKVSELELELKDKNDALMEATYAVGKAQQDPDKADVMQPEMEAKLMRSITDIAELARWTRAHLPALITKSPA